MNPDNSAKQVMPITAFFSKIISCSLMTQVSF